MKKLIALLAALTMLFDLQMRTRGYDSQLTGMDDARALHRRVYERFEAGDADGAEAAMLVDDGLHPSAAMYRLWMEQALPVAADLLTNPTAA